MFKITSLPDSGILEVEITGRIETADYDDTLTPAIEAILADHSHFRVLVILGPGFEGFDAGAMLADAKLGLSHWHGFERIAFVTDKSWVANSVRIFAPLMPCPAQVFDLDQTDEARRWLRESLGAVNIVELDADTLHVSLLGQLSVDILRQTAGDLEAKLRGKEQFNLVLDLRAFEGWQGVTTLGAHAALVREFSPRLARAAVVGDKAWQRAAQALMGALLTGETQFFEGDALDRAMLWARDG